MAQPATIPAPAGPRLLLLAIAAILAIGTTYVANVFDHAGTTDGVTVPYPAFLMLLEKVPATPPPPVEGANPDARGPFLIDAENSLDLVHDPHAGKHQLEGTILHAEGDTVRFRTEVGPALLPELAAKLKEHALAATPVTRETSLTALLLNPLLPVVIFTLLIYSALNLGRIFLDRRSSKTSGRS